MEPENLDLVEGGRVGALGAAELGDGFGGEANESVRVNVGRELHDLPGFKSSPYHWRWRPRLPLVNESFHGVGNGNAAEALMRPSCLWYEGGLPA